GHFRDWWPTNLESARLNCEQISTLPRRVPAVKSAHRGCWSSTPTPTPPPSPPPKTCQLPDAGHDDDARHTVCTGAGPHSVPEVMTEYVGALAELAASYARGGAASLSQLFGVGDQVGRDGGAATDLGVVAEAPAEGDPQLRLVIGDEGIQDRAVGFVVPGEADGVSSRSLPVCRSRACRTPALASAHDHDPRRGAGRSVPGAARHLPRVRLAPGDASPARRPGPTHRAASPALGAVARVHSGVRGPVVRGLRRRMVRGGGWGGRRGLHRRTGGGRVGTR